jgi:hypothetical protein
LIPLFNDGKSLNKRLMKNKHIPERPAAALKNTYIKRALLTGITGLALAVNAQTYTFTPCGATGSLGPTQTSLNTAYAATNLNGLVTTTNGIQSFMIPTPGMYRIDVSGASGGNHTSPASAGGLGSRMEGEFFIPSGSELKVLVGQRGINGSGGGGTYVVLNDTVLLIVAGGGGGATSENTGAHSTTLTSGTNDHLGGVIPGGVNGGGGQTCNMTALSSHGGGGGGYLGDGSMPGGLNCGCGGGGLSFLNGGTGGSGAAPGGFGGGGGSINSGNLTVGGAGGGGYSGGAGGQQVNVCAPGLGRTGGGGGGSYNSGTNQLNTPGVNTGDGMLILTKLCDVELSASKSSICAGESVTLLTNGITGPVWSNGATGTSVVVSPATNTSYTVTGQGLNGTTTCTASLSLSLTVHPLPVLSGAVTPGLLCAGKTATLTASGASSYTWTSSSLVSHTAAVTPSVTTSYSYSGTDVYGCVSTTVISVAVNTNSLGITSNTSVCEGSSVKLSASGAQTYSWSTGSVFQTIPVSPLSDASYTVTGKDIHGCELSNTVAVSVLPLPQLSLTALRTTVCAGESVSLEASGAETYLWNNGATTARISERLPLNVIYHYTVTGTAANGCSDRAYISVSVSECLGIASHEARGEVKVYPNPVTGDEITVATGGEGNTTVEISDLSGRVLILFSGQDSELKINTGSLAKGVYYVKVRSDRHHETLKLVKNQ